MSLSIIHSSEHITAQYNIDPVELQFWSPPNTRLQCMGATGLYPSEMTGTNMVYIHTPTIPYASMNLFLRFQSCWKKFLLDKLKEIYIFCHIFVFDEITNLNIQNIKRLHLYFDIYTPLNWFSWLKFQTKESQKWSCLQKIFSCQQRL